MSSTASPHPLDNRTLQRIALAIVLLATLIASFSYPGNKLMLVIFGVLSALMVRATLANRTSMFSFFLFAFLILGCWAKFVIHFILDTEFIEPIGSFDHSARSWDSALDVLNVAFAILLLCNAFATRTMLQNPVLPRPYKPTAIMTLAFWSWAFMTVQLLAINFKFAILKVGTEPLLQLPSTLYMVFSFMIGWGNLILLAALGYWLVAANKLKAEILFYVLILEGALAAISMGSRAQMILHIAAPFVICLTQTNTLNWSFSRKQWLRIILATGALFIGSILAVSADRIHSFAKARVATTDPIAIAPVAAPAQPPAVPDAIPAPSLPAPLPAAPAPVDAAPVVTTAPAPAPVVAPAPAVDPQSQLPGYGHEPSKYLVTLMGPHWAGMVEQLAKLIVDRWVGLEGVLTVTSAPQRGLHLFAEGLQESPTMGTQAIYQRMADARYQTFENFTFMTIPGPIAILAYADNVVIMVLGLAILFAAGVLGERAAIRLTGNSLAQATVAVALAYLVVQTNFPRVQLLFLIELLAFLLGLYILKHLFSPEASERIKHLFTR